MLNKYKLFLRWWLFVTLVFIGGVYCWNLGLFQEIWDKDITKLSFVIMAIFGYMSLWCGVKTWQISAMPRDQKNKIHLADHHARSKKIKELSEVGWFISDIFLTMGMIGTLVGFIVMFSSGFASIDISNIKAAQAALAHIAVGMSTALYTTLIGLVSSALLKVQYFNLTLGLKEAVKK